MLVYGIPKNSLLFYCQMPFDFRIDSHLSQIKSVNWQAVVHFWWCLLLLSSLNCRPCFPFHTIAIFGSFRFASLRFTFNSFHCVVNMSQVQSIILSEKRCAQLSLNHTQPLDYHSNGLMCFFFCLCLICIRTMLFIFPSVGYIHRGCLCWVNVASSKSALSKTKRAVFADAILVSRCIKAISVLTTKSWYKTTIEFWNGVLFEVQNSRGVRSECDVPKALLMELNGMIIIVGFSSLFVGLPKRAFNCL